jgi:hypothetical protein
MWSRIQFESFATPITVIAFVIMFSAFLHFCWKAFRMKPSERDYLSHLPLEENDSPTPSPKPDEI